MFVFCFFPNPLVSPFSLYSLCVVAQQKSAVSWFCPLMMTAAYCEPPDISTQYVMISDIIFHININVDIYIMLILIFDDDEGLL